MSPQKTRVIAAVILTMISTLGALALAWRSQEATGWVDHSRQVQAATNKLLMTLIDAETGQRGFLITRDDSYLEPYRRATAELNQRVADLKSLTRDSPEQQAAVNALDPLIATRLAALDSGLKLIRAGDFDGAINFVKNNVGKSTMDAIRLQIETIAETEQTLLDARSASLSQIFRWLIAGVIVSLLGAIALAGTISNAFFGHVKDLKALNESLETRVNDRTNQLLRETLQYQIALEAGNLGSWELDSIAETSKRTFRHDEIFGYDQPIEHWNAENFFAHVVGDERERVQGEVAKAFATKGEWTFETRIRRANDNAERWIEVRGTPRFDADGSVAGYVGLVGDITERKQREEHLTFVTDELAHRSKNLLSIIGSLSSQTARYSNSVDDYKNAFAERLMALSRSQDLLINSDRLVNLLDLCEAQVRAFATPRQVTITGPEIKVSHAIAQALGFALHELATNAIKYGALSLPTGRVEITWDVKDGCVALQWMEIGGPPVRQPTRKGFGSTVINELCGRQIGGSAQTLYTPTGVLWTTEFPLSDAVLKS